jgi:2-amino-4-hydroxy-6-hydroxymethyldihydropteridine diphosphokinase
VSGATSSSGAGHLAATGAEPARRTVLVALGSNIDPAANLPRAARRLAARFPGLAASRLYATEPVGAPAAPPFLNAAVALATDLPLVDLRDRVLRPLEAELGRVRGADPNAPRPIDLDLAFAGGLVIRDPVSGLEVPDPEIVRRAHLALPLADLAPDAVHPLDGRTLAAIAAAFAGAPGVRVVGGPEAVLGEPSAHHGVPMPRAAPDPRA